MPVDVSILDPLRSHAEYNVISHNRAAGRMVRQGDGYAHAPGERCLAEAQHRAKLGALTGFQEITRQRVRRQRAAEKAVSEERTAARAREAAARQRNLKYCAANYITNRVEAPPPPSLRVEIALGDKTTTTTATAAAAPGGVPAPRRIALIDEAGGEGEGSVAAGPFVDLSTLHGSARPPPPPVTHHTSTLSIKGAFPTPDASRNSTLLFNTTLALNYTKTA